MQLVEFIDTCEYKTVQDRVIIYNNDDHKTVYEGSFITLKKTIRNYSWANDLLVSWFIGDDYLVIKIDLEYRDAIREMKEMALNHELRENEKYPDRNFFNERNFNI